MHAPKAAMQITGMMDDNAILPQANIRLEAAKQVLDRIGIVKKDQIDADKNREVEISSGVTAEGVFTVVNFDKKT